MTENALEYARQTALDYENSEGRQLTLLREKYELEKETEDLLYCAIEEMSEATKVMTKFLRRSLKFSYENLTEELAHSLLLLDVVRKRFSIDMEDIRHEQFLAMKKVYE